MIRIGLLLDSTQIQAWQAEVIRQIITTSFAEISLLIFNTSPKPSGDPSPFLYKAYRKIDRLVFNSKQDAFEFRDIASLVSAETKQLKVSPIQKKYRDFFPAESIEQIRSHDLDVLLRFGFRILSGEILNVPKHGVWSYHHGDPSTYRGGPPAFWEVMKALPITGVVLQRLTEKLDQGQVIYQSFTQTNPLSVQRNANSLFWLSSTFVSRVIREIQQSGWEAWENGLRTGSSKSDSPLWKPPGNWQLLPLMFQLIGRNWRRKLRESVKKPHWTIGLYTPVQEGKVAQLGPKLVQEWEHPDPQNFYWADPFPILIGEKEFVLVEEFDKRNQKGRIVCLKRSANGLQIHPALQESWHLSYPFVWQENGKIFLIPESAEAGKVFLYQAIDFPTRWEQKNVLLDVEAYDPTLIKSEGVYWLFVNQKAHPECSPFDELHLYFSESLEVPSWTPHPQNPIVSDVRKSRPAGRIFLQNGKLFRPAQDSGLRYGYRVHIQEIVCLTKTAYVEKTVQTLESAPDFALGVHTYNQGKLGVWIDLFRRK